MAIIFREENSIQAIMIVIGFAVVIDMMLIPWSCFSFLMRIEIDFNKNELYIFHFTIIKRIKFDEIENIEIDTYTDIEYKIIITLKNKKKKIVFSYPYLKKTKTKKRIDELEKLKNDLNDIKTQIQTKI